ncbi:MAG: hypothetical protein GY846_17860, partial [Deltaproteobacteria bacterium]|nr:hypothetical protein [Deltaproteobacteria bacterium]
IEHGFAALVHTAIEQHVRTQVQDSEARHDDDKNVNESDELGVGAFFRLGFHGR